MPAVKPKSLLVEAHSSIRQLALASTSMRGFRVTYDRWLRDSPLLTKGVTSAVLFGIGDRVAQVIERSDSADTDTYRHGLHRTARMMLWGGVLFAPVGHAWYNFLERAVRGKGTASIVKKIAADQLVFSPPLSLAFFTYAGCSEGKSLRDTMETAVAKLPPTLAVNWTVWPLVHVCTFGFVPLQYRILFINVVNIGWSAFLSRMASNDGQVPSAAKLKEFFFVRHMEDSEEAATA